MVHGGGGEEDSRDNELPESNSIKKKKKKQSFAPVRFVKNGNELIGDRETLLRSHPAFRLVVTNQKLDTIHKRNSFTLSVVSRELIPMEKKKFSFFRKEIKCSQIQIRNTNKIREKINRKCLV